MVMTASPVRATCSVFLWKSATPMSVSANRMKSTGIPKRAGPSARGGMAAILRQEDHVRPVGPVRSDDHRLLDVGGARGAGDEPGGARRLADLLAQQREGILHRVHDARLAHHRDVR